MFRVNASARPFSPAISSQHLLAQARAHKAVENLEAAKKSYRDAVEKAQAEHERNPADRKAKEAFDAICNEFFTFLGGVQEQNAAANLEEPSDASPSFSLKNPSLPINRNDTDTPRPRSAQRAQEVEACIVVLSHGIKPLFSEKRPSPSELALVQTATSISMPAQQQPVTSLAQEKSVQVDYLFEKALSTLASLEIPNKPSLFFVYAHNNPAYGEAKADIAKYLIDQLSTLRANLYSDQTPMGPTYSSPPDARQADGKLEDILTSQLCLLPGQLRNDVKPVDKVVVCCSDLLGKYLAWPHYGDFRQDLQKAYHQDLKQRSTSAIREVVRKYSQEEPYQAGFHYVLTEIAFLQIRKEEREDQHGIIPVSLIPDSYERCLAHFIPATTVRLEDILRFEEQAQAGQTVYPNQSRHWVLFKLIERLLVGSDEAKTFLNHFWQGYSDCICQLEKAPSTFEELEFVKLVDSIFDNIRTALHSQLVSTVQQVQKLRPPNLSLIDLRNALHRHYQSSNLSIQRVSGEAASLDDCYINLAIVESHAQRKQDKEALQKQASAFDRLPSSERLKAMNPNKLIALDSLFEPRQLRNGLTGMPKRILIQGRAGIGKTTLCKKLVYDYQHNTAWQEQFDSVIWVPLRQLKTLQIYSLDKLLRKHYFASAGTGYAQALAQRVLDHQDKTLFILDGLDEVVSELDKGYPLSEFLQTLLNQAHVVITSRPAGVNAHLLGQLDLELETIGFSQKDVQAYIQTFAPENQATIQQFINRNPLILGLVNIPIQLDALCYSWDKLPKDPEAVTMTSLYEAMVDKLWRKDGVRLEKQDKGKTLAANVIQVSSKAKLEKLMDDEIHYLGYLAFKGLEEGKIEFSLEELDQRQAELEDKCSGKELSFSFTTDLKKTSYLHTADAERPEIERHYHFLHLTFQEFFAAKFLVWHLQAGLNIVRTDSWLMLSQEKLKAFIAEHKYDPRYEIVWEIVAGLLKGAALARFFALLEGVPRDLIGGRHQQVMMGCLSEARTQLDKTTVDKLETELMQWLRFELKFSRSGMSELGSQKAFPEHLLLTCLDQFKGQEENIISTLGARLTLSEVAILALISALQDDSGSIRNAAAIALVNQKILPEVAISALNDALKDKSEQIRSTVAWIIEAQQTQSKAAISTLIYKLRDEDRQVRFAAVQALRDQKTLPEAAISALTDTLQDEDKQVRSLAAWALGEQETLPEAAISALTNALQDEDQLVRSTAAWAFGKQKTLPKAVISALTHTLQDEDKQARYVTAWALREQKTLPEAAIPALTNALQDEDEEVRAAAAGALGKQKTLPEATISALTNALQDENQAVKSAVAEALREQEMLPEAAISALTNTLQEEGEQARSVAAGVLGAQETQSEATISALTHALQDEDKLVRLAAADALVKQKTLPEAAIFALIHALQDENQSVKSLVAEALREQEMLPEAAISALTNALQEEDRSVRSAAAWALCKQKTLPEAAISALVNALQDENQAVKSWVAEALREQEMLPEAAISALTNALQEEDRSVRSAAAWALCKQKTLPEAAISALTHMLQEEDRSLRSEAALALGWHLDQLYTSLPSLALDQVQILYTRVLFPQSCKQIAPLYIQDNKLHFYTEAGLGQPISVTSEQCAMLIKAFVSVQAEAQIAPCPEESYLYCMDS